MTDGGKQEFVKHLEMIQGVVDRLAGNSSANKKWSVGAVLAALLFTARFGENLPFALFAIPIVLFWAFDAYYLHKERQFRGLYDSIRTQEATDFNMDVGGESSMMQICWLLFQAFLKLAVFYIPQVIFVVWVGYCLPSQASADSPQFCMCVQKRQVLQCLGAPSAAEGSDQLSPSAAE